MKTKYLAAIGTIALLASCSNEVWYDEAPEEIVGIWHETLDEVVARVKAPDVLTIENTLVTHAKYIPQEKSQELRSLPIQKVKKCGNTVRILCGKPDEYHIAERMFELDLEQNPRSAIVWEIPLSRYGEGAHWYVGKFLWTAGDEP